MSYELSQSEIRQFYDDGYLLVEGLYTRDEVEELAAAAERLRAVGREIAEGVALSEDGGEVKVEHAGSQFVIGANRRLLRIVWAGGCEPAFLDAGRDPRLTS